jgi:hypothetical protein
MPRWDGPNLLRSCGIVLRNLTIQKGVGGEDKRELVTVESLGRVWGSAHELSHNDLDDPNHRLIDDLWSWHVDDGAPPYLSVQGKIALYMPFSIPGRTTKVAALDIDLFRNKDGQKIDFTARTEYLERSKDLHNKSGIPFLWAFSRSYGIHHWYFFESQIPCTDAHQFIRDIRKAHFESGLYKIDESDLENKVDLRPKTNNPNNISEAHRLLIPYSGWYPYTNFFTSTDTTSPVSKNYTPELIPTSLIPKGRQVAQRQSAEDALLMDMPHIAFRAKREWSKITTDQDANNRDKIEPFESGVDIQGLIPCATTILANRTEIPEGQWHNFTFLLSQSIASLNMDEKETALDQVTEVLNRIGEFGNYPPDSHERFRITVNSAYRELSKGLPLACRRANIARENCCSVKCNLVTGGYLKAQRLLDADQPRIYKRIYTDPLANKVKGSRYISLCMPAYLLEEFRDDPRDNPGIFFEFDSRETMKFERFAAAVQSLGMKNIEKYDAENLLASFPHKDFSMWMNNLVIRMAVPIEDGTPLFKADFMRILGKSISRRNCVSLTYEPNQDHQIRIWHDSSGRRCLAVLYSVMHGIAVDLMRRSGGLDADEIIDFYMNAALPGSKIIGENIRYIDINYHDNAKEIPLDAGSAQLLERSFERLVERNVVTPMSRHKKV